MDGDNFKVRVRISGGEWDRRMMKAFHKAARKATEKLKPDPRGYGKRQNAARATTTRAALGSVDQDL